ncbi:amyloid-beta A4 precursor protein-binding family A member 3 [Elgaria multicarinata webbii]|uniref:amyloid-beta A4 precursor protein-binding family A member 3 n=1 Tax=Elgaria multicarinata webbii TaxID=159646 RepID=UPI002FCD106F
MTGNSMDFKMDAIQVHDVPVEFLEPPPMDLEENIAAEGEVTDDPAEDVPDRQQQPISPSDSLRAIFTPPSMESGLCHPKVQSGPDHAEDPKWSQSYTDLGVKDSSRNPMEECAELGAQEHRESEATEPVQASEVGSRPQDGVDQDEHLMELEEAAAGEDSPESEQFQLQGLLAQLQRLSPTFHDSSPTSEDGLLPGSNGEEGRVFGGEGGPLLGPAGCQGRPGECAPCPLHIATGRGLGAASRRLLRSAHGRKGRGSRGLLSADADSEDLLSLLRYEGGLPAEVSGQLPLARSDAVAGTGCQGAQGEERGVAPETPAAPSSCGSDRADRKGGCRWVRREGGVLEEGASSDSGSGARGSPEPGWAAVAAPGSRPAEELSPESDLSNKTDLSSFPAYKEVPGPCEPEDLLDGVIFGAKYLGSTQLVSERNPPTSIRMAQAQEAVDRIKAPDGESQPMTEVDLFVSTQRIKVLTADSQEAMMDHPLQTISYIADIGKIVVLMARRKLPRRADTSVEKQLYKMICHVFHSPDAQVIAQAIGQAFSVAYQRFLRASGIDPTQLNPRQCGDEDDEDEPPAEGEEELYNGDLAHFSKQENCKEVIISKQKGEILGVVIVESGWGSILPTVVIANLMHRGAAERSGKLSIGDRIMSVNGTSLVGLPLASCQNTIRDLKSQTEVTLTVVHCPPVTTAIVRRPDVKYPLGFCVENGIICSLMRGGIAERGGIRVGHRIIEINGQSVVAMPHEKIIQILTQAVSEVHIKTMPASTYRLLTGQEQPVFL